MELLSIKEARELAELTDRIAANLAIFGVTSKDELITLNENVTSMVGNFTRIANLISDDTPNIDELFEQTNTIVANLWKISLDNTDTDGMAKDTNLIVANLKTINEDGIDLDDLLEQTNAISNNLSRIGEMNTSA